MCYDMYGEREDRNRSFMGAATMGISFTQLILGLLALVAQIGFYYYCNWNAVCLVLPSFIPIILIIIASIIGIFAAIEKSNSLIITCLIFGILIIIAIPIGLGIWLGGWEPAMGQGTVLETVESAGDDTFSAVVWGLLILSCILWLLFLVTVILCSMAICCPEEAMMGKVGPSVVYASAPQPQPTYIQTAPAPKVVQVQVPQVQQVQYQVKPQPIQTVQVIQPQVTARPYVFQ